MSREFRTANNMMEFEYKHMNKQSWPGKLLLTADEALGSITASLDRKFHAAMERCFQEDPERSSDIRLLKRTVLVVVSLGIGISALSLGLAVESQVVHGILG